MQISLLFENSTVLKTFTLNNTHTSFSFILPIIKSVSETATYNAFPSFILKFESDSFAINGSMLIHQVLIPSLKYIGPYRFALASNQKLLFNYTVENSMNYEITINNKTYVSGTLKNTTIPLNTFNVTIDRFAIGFYVVDIIIQDSNGLIDYTQFTFSIEKPTFLFGLSFEETIILCSIVGIITLAFVLLYFYNKKHPGKIRVKLTNYIGFKKKKTE